MSIFKHSKFKNTGIIFELLSRQLVSDILNEKKSPAPSIIKKYFKKNSELGKELALYRTIQEFNYNKKTSAAKLIDLVLEEHVTIDKIKLKAEKYKLLGEIKNNFDEEVFFNSRLTNYKLLASIYKLFENTSNKLTKEYINTYDTIVEHITNKKEVINDGQIELWTKQPKEVKQLAFKLALEHFNKKYSILNNKQKTLISKYVYENIDHPDFKDYILTECAALRKSLSKISKTITDPVLKIKMTEIVELLNEIQTAKFVKDEYLQALLSYYELEVVLGNGK